MRANAGMRESSHRFLDAEALAVLIRGREGVAAAVDDPGVSQQEG